MLKALPLILGLVGTSLVAQSAPKSIDDDLMALLNEPITVASTKPMSPPRVPRHRHGLQPRGHPGVRCP